MQRHRLEEPPRRRSGATSRPLRGRLHLGDPLLWVGVIGLACLGLLNLVGLGDSAEAAHQLLTVGGGVAVAVLLWRTRSRLWIPFGRVLYAVAVLLLAAVTLAGSSGVDGGRRWLAVGGALFQPSEFAKIGLLLVLADVLGDRRREHRFLIALGLAALPIGLTLIEPDLSTSLLLMVIFAAVAIQARVRARSLVAVAAAGAASIPLGLHLLRPYQLERLHSFLSGGAGALGSGWTVLQAHIAVASGGLLGNHSAVPYSLLSQYLPARETDLALVSLVEQHGLITGAAVFLFTALVMWRLMTITREARTEGAGLVGGGFAVLLGTEVAISAAGGIGLVPLAGVPCPLISAGGSAAVATLAAIGVALSIRRDAEDRVLWRAPQRLRRMPRLARVSAFGLGLALVGTGAVMLQLQTGSGQQLRTAALAEVTRTISLPAPRGEIVDRHGVPLVTEKRAWEVVVIPGLLSGHPASVARLARLVGEAPAKLQGRLDAAGAKLSVTLPGTVTSRVEKRITADHLPGVILDPSYQPVDPYASLLGPLLGTTGLEWADQVKQLGLLPPNDVVGHTGLEAEYDRYLRGQDGAQRVMVSPLGSAVALSSRTAPVAGGTLQTTIDLPLQQEAASLLSLSMAGAYPDSQTGDWGSMIVMDAKTGAILAMAGQGLDGAANAVAGEMPPGSTFKLVVSSADMVYKAIPPSKVIPTGCTYTYDGFTYHNWTCLPPQDLPEAIAWSNDVYFYKLALALGPQRIATVARELGVGALSGIDLPTAIQSSGQFYYPGHMPSGEVWYPGVTPMMGIGQGYTSVTPMQDIRWLDAAATGELVTPHLGLAVARSGSSSPLSFSSTTLPFAGSLGPVRDGLGLEVTQGTGTMLRNLPQPAGGKTGTAQDPSAPHGGPDAWYDAVYPLANPQVVVLCAVHGGGQGYYDCEPAVDSLLEYFAAHEAQIMPVTPVTASGGTAAPVAAPPTTSSTPAATPTPQPSHPSHPAPVADVPRTTPVPAARPTSTPLPSSTPSASPTPTASPSPTASPTSRASPPASDPTAGPSPGG